MTRREWGASSSSLARTAICRDVAALFRYMLASQLPWAGFATSHDGQGKAKAQVRYRRGAKSGARASPRACSKTEQRVKLSLNFQRQMMRQSPQGFSWLLFALLKIACASLAYGFSSEVATPRCLPSLCVSHEIARGSREGAKPAWATRLPT
jgi:hypothetical protein